MSQEDNSDFSAAHFIVFFATVFSREDRDPAGHQVMPASKVVLQPMTAQKPALILPAVMKSPL